MLQVAACDSGPGYQLLWISAQFDKLAATIQGLAESLVVWPPQVTDMWPPHRPITCQSLTAGGMDLYHAVLAY